MPLTAARRAQLDKLTLPDDAQMQARTRRFMLHSGLTIEELADCIGYARSSLGLFLQGRYGLHHEGKRENTKEMRARLKEFMDLHELQAESRLDSHRHYETSSVTDVRRATLNALNRGTAYIVDGPPGTQKTHALLHVGGEIKEQDLGRFVYVYARINHSPQSFLMECCCAAGIPNRGTIDQLLRKLRFFLAGKRTVFVVDEAQHLDNAGLEVLRQLLDLPPYFGVVLAGSHDLTQRVSHWQMEQWRSRVRKTIFLNGPSREEARAILRGELGQHIPDAVCDQTIASCTSAGVRTVRKGNKAVEQPYEFISARDLFFSIEHAQDTLATPKGAAKCA
ncbi:AAA family ATPase [Granulicella cerasi]|uniref:AAA family ATPase n=1 Tax=Granulicella cerasi TaxID=741063 RepID=A0ABW1ZBA1_9BACT|nr:ATP-binding protein [Granulicella cerasi]